MRDLRVPDAIDSTRIAHLALLSDAVFQSYDLALHCMDILEARGDADSGAIDAYVDLLPRAVRR